MKDKVDAVAEKVAPSEFLAYFLYGFGQCFSYGIVGSFILIYYTDVVGIASVIASAIFLIARVWDAVFDPIVSGFMDKGRNTHGKFRKYMKIAPIFIVVSTIACFFTPSISMTGKIAYAAASYILWGTTYAFSDIPFWSMSTVMTKDSRKRTNLVTTASLGVSAGGGMVAIVLPFMLAYFKNNQTPATSYLISIMILMIIGFVFMQIGYRFTKERVKPSSKSEKITTHDIIMAVKANKYLLKMLLIMLLKIFMEIVNCIIIYFFTYNLGNAKFMSIFGVIGTFSAITFLVIPFITRYFKKLQILRFLLISDIIFRVIFFALGYKNVTLVFILLTVTQCIYGLTGPITVAMLSETVEYTEVKTGKRCEAIVFGGQTFASKLAIAFAGATTGLILSFISYQPNTAQSSSTLTGLFIIISILPALGSLLRLWVLKGYDYNEDDFRNCRKILDERAAKLDQEDDQSADVDNPAVANGLQTEATKATGDAS
ncbi:MFS transporter [Secundilactobacillus yichangensis]|uniref:MFS transporter n=1 Tax=Secundilactobacillus yichangensis TaxID=2799580 RepID=UPI001941DAC2|nr:glycoside-pentoside-hexuronide (GPH):cation symporter [Secundilactobacillus yichangensis]